MALYQRYRPLVFEDVIGQREAVTVLQAAVATGAVPHALLFAGTHGTGKTTLARLVAAGLCCLSDSARPCGACDGCVSVQRGRHPDVWELDAASHRGVDDARRINDRLAHAPMMATAHVVILDEAHMLTREAQNALLKTIEEPPSPVHIMLCTTEAHRVLPTIRSRCQRYPLRKPDPADIVHALERVVEHEGIAAEAEGLSIIAHVADGSFRDALSLAEQVLGGHGDLSAASATEGLNMPQRDLLEELVAEWRTQDIGALHRLLERISRSGINWPLLTTELAQHVADALLDGAAPEVIAIIGACDRALQSSLPYPLALEYCLAETWTADSTSSTALVEPSSSPAHVAPMPNPRPSAPPVGEPDSSPPTRSASAPAIGDWSAARIAVMLPLIAIAARGRSPRVYLALRTAQATSRGTRLRLFSREFDSAPEELEAWIAQWGPVEVEWKSGRRREAAAQPADEDIVEAAPAPRRAPRSDAFVDEGDLDETLASLRILAVDEP